MTNLTALAPLAAVAGTALFVLLLEAFAPRLRGRVSGPLAAIGFVAAFVLNARAWGKGGSMFSGALVLDDVSVVFSGLIYVTGILVVLMGLKYVPDSKMDSGAFHALLLLAFSGLSVMVSSGNLLVVFLGLEVLSISSYALAGLKRDDPESIESAVKYFMMGSFAAAFTFFGLAFVHGGAESLEIPFIRAAASSPALTAGLGLVLAGLGFKIALVPFHMWAPDVYQGAPTSVTAFFATGTKIGGFIALFRIFGPLASGPLLPAGFGTVLGIAAAGTMIVGSLAALRQQNIKRLLAYSSIVHSGYILLAVLSGDGPGLAFYLAVYALMSAGAFGSVMAAGSAGRERLEIGDYAGLGTTSPWNAALFSIFLLSLAGFPPTGGFLAKFLVFGKAVERGLVPLVVIAVLASLVSSFYYLRVIAVMYMKPPGPGFPADRDQPGLFLALFICLVAVLQLGIWPGNLLAIIRSAFLF
ncbi:MAG: nuoN-1 [Candidatus Aminicenantes bacterium]|nr:nuoN-1 [Candidatus Aminicenantes bacterium]